MSFGTQNSVCMKLCLESLIEVHILNGSLFFDIRLDFTYRKICIRDENRSLDGVEGWKWRAHSLLVFWLFGSHPWGKVEDYGTIITSHNPLLGLVKCHWANNSYFLYSFLAWTNIVTKYRTYGLCYLKLISRGACGH